MSTTDKKSIFGNKSTTYSKPQSDNITKMIVDNISIKYIVEQKYAENHEVIDLSDLDTSRCTDLSFLFYGMTGLEEIKNLNKLDLSNVTNMESMCCDCSALKELDLSGANLSNVTSMELMCADCRSLEKLNLSGLDLRNVKKMTELCCNCSALEKIDLSVTVLRDAIDVTNMCKGCNSLSEFKVNEECCAPLLYVMDYLFALREERSIDFGLKHSIDELILQQHGVNLSNTLPERLKQLIQKPLEI